MKVWQTTTTAALGHFEIRENILFNEGSASENLSGVGKNSRTHNFFVVSNSIGNPVLRSTITHNFTFSGTNTPRTPVNAFGLNYGMLDCRLDSNVLTGQTRLGFNNTPKFKTQVSGNKIISGIPSAYAYYLWGFTNTDFPLNEYIDNPQFQPNEYHILYNQYENNRSHLVIYNWQNQDYVNLNMMNHGWKKSDEFILINVLDLYNDSIRGRLNSKEEIEVPMNNRTLTKAVGVDKDPVSQYPTFGTFILIRIPNIINAGDNQSKLELELYPNPCQHKLMIHSTSELSRVEIYSKHGQFIKNLGIRLKESEINELDLSLLTSGIYWLKIFGDDKAQWRKFVVE